MVDSGVASEPEDPLLLSRCHENFIQAFQFFASHSPHYYLQESEGLVRIVSRVPGPAFNLVFITRPLAHPARDIRDAADLMVRCHADEWRIVALPGTTEGVASAATESGLEPGSSVPGMLLRPVPELPRGTPVGVRIQPADTADLWQQMVEVGTVAMTGEPWPNVEWILPYSSTDRLRGYVAFDGRIPVGTALAFAHRGVCGIFFVATDPKARGRGIGTALTSQAAADGRRDGCEVSYLQSSKLGYSVYSKLGYQHVADYAQWYTPERLHP